MVKIWCIKLQQNTYYSYAMKKNIFKKQKVLHFFIELIMIASA